jgi:hypothetical protein
MSQERAEWAGTGRDRRGRGGIPTPKHSGRIGGIEAMLRVRAGAQGPRRAADGASKAARRAGTRDATTPWGTPLPWPPSLEDRGRELGRIDSGCARFSTTPAGVVPGPRPASAPARQVPGAPISSAPLPGPSHTPAPARLPPHPGQAKPVQCQRPPEQLGESLLAASSPSSAPCCPLPGAPRSSPHQPVQVSINKRAR